MNRVFYIVLVIVISFIATAQVSAQGYAIVTGASRGIGKTIAIELLDKGYNLILIARSIHELENIKNELKADPLQNVQIYALDVTKASDTEMLANEIKQQNLDIRVLINNVGIAVPGTSQLSTDELRSLVNTNLMGAHNMVHNILPFMKRSGAGYIINIGSFAGNKAIRGWGGYSASKYALRGYSDSLYKELAAYGIKVSCISPSLTATESANKYSMPGYSDIAKTVSYLLSLGDNALIRDVELANTKLLAEGY